MGLTVEKKDEIRAALETYKNRYGGVQKAAASLNNVSASTIYSILGRRYDNISDQLWRNLRSQIMGSRHSDWVIVETTATRDITFAMNDTKENVGISWIIAKAGGSKTISAQKFVEENKNAFYVLCDEDMKKVDFGIALGRAVGMRMNTQKKARHIIMEVIDEIKEMENPVLIFDEGDKLGDAILYYFITIVNHLIDKCTIIFLSTDYMIKRMEDGIRLRRKGFAELYSRIGCKFYISDENDANDVFNICKANGLNNPDAIAEVIKDSETVRFDMRRVKKKVIALRKKLCAMGGVA